MNPLPIPGAIGAARAKAGRRQAGLSTTLITLLATSWCLGGLLSTAHAVHDHAAADTGATQLIHNGDPRNYDGRLTLGAELTPPLQASYPEQAQALMALQQRQEGELSVSFAPGSGVTRTLSNTSGYLSEPATGKPAAIARQWLDGHQQLLGLTAADVAAYEITDSVYSQVSGATHLYWRQLHQGIPVYNGQLQFNINRNGRLQSVNNAFVRELARAANSPQPRLSVAQAVTAAGQHLQQPVKAVEILSSSADVRRTSTVSAKDLSSEPFSVSLMWLPIAAGDVRLVWRMEFWTRDSQHLYDITVDAASGEVWTRFDLVSSAAYRVYEQPVESPIHTTPSPPSDARTLVIDPEDATASPNGWFDSGSTIMDGNNVHACVDADGNNSCDSGQASCGGSLVCDFSLNLSSSPANSRPAAVANLFYWNNLIHDVQYQYGFDEAGGNFQESNFGRGGAGSDSVNADAQDGSGNCNANFGTPSDGGNPRMQMFTCNNATPARDGDFDNGVIVHEYGHGISTRQVGGPSNSSCLRNRQQAGEGWSDILALIYTARAGDQGSDRRGLGSYLIDLPPDGTIRPQNYSTDPAINNYTYASMNGLSVPHGVGSVWAQVAWEMYWALVTEYGFEADLLNFDINDPNEAGNKRALFYINEGLKNTACSPTFVDNRDGIIQAVTDNFGGADLCRVWQVFADYGLGTDAVSGGSGSTTPSNGFSLPAACDNNPPPPPPPPPGDCPAGSINFNAFAVESYADQDISGGAAVADGGDTLVLTGNSWKRSLQSFNVTANTVVAFDFASSSQGEIHAIGFDEDQTLNNQPRHFQFWGSQNWTGGGKIDWTPKYTGGGTFQSYQIPVGQQYTGASMRLVFTNDNDGGSGNEGRFRCVRVFEDGAPPPPPPSCSVAQDFDSGASGWTSGGDCATGSFELGTPTAVSNGGVTTQVAGDHTSGSGNALFTATNSSAGVDDVDGGTCTLQSPLFTVGEASTLSLWYFHGQRDAGDDAADGFDIELSTDGGASFNSLVSIGDVISNAAWTETSAAIAAGASVQLRILASDGPNAGDLIEAGIDDLSICAQ
ncbi:MAG: hypothetical protein Tsb002_28660 [Wenzhouxiangellaceae bacterium]